MADNTDLKHAASRTENVGAGAAGGAAAGAVIAVLVAVSNVFAPVVGGVAGSLLGAGVGYWLDQRKIRKSAELEKKPERSRA